MARTVRDSSLETRAARARLKQQHKPYYRLIDQGCHLGYYKGPRGGAWSARYFVGAGKYAEKTLGIADDTQDADGKSVLTFADAQRAARTWFAIQARLATGEGHIGPYRVADAWQDYLNWFGQHRKSLKAMEVAADAHILPALGTIDVTELTTAKLRQWHEKLAATPPRVRSTKGEGQKFRTVADDLDAVRRRKATANRVLTILKAALNYAWREGKAPSDEAWRRVRPFHNVDAPRIRYLASGECRCLIAACAEEFRPLALAALYTGCRYGELIALRVSDYDSASSTLRVRQSKSGKPRHVYLNDEAGKFFSALRYVTNPDRVDDQAATGAGATEQGPLSGIAANAARLSGGQSAQTLRRGEEPIFLRADGSAWKRSDQIRPLAKACAAAGIAPAVSFHILRHTYASLLVMAGAPLQVVAHNLGHADTRMTERHYAHLASSYVADTIRTLAPKFVDAAKSDRAERAAERTAHVQQTAPGSNVVPFNPERRRKDALTA